MPASGYNLETSCAAPEGKPLVSVGIPVYNGAEHLGEAIESALAQDYGSFEIVISDNASTDRTEQICRRFARQDCRIRYFRQATNQGVGNNFANVLKMATGKYFTWLSHDDVLSSKACLSVLVDFLEGHPDVVVCASAIHLLDYEIKGTKSPKEFPTIHPETPWSQARAEFFRWPQQGVSSYPFYGMFRRDELTQINSLEMLPNERILLTGIEYRILTALCAHGRIVALPDFLRSCRFRLGSVGQAERDSLSGFDRFVLGMRLKLRILLNAWQIPLRPGEKMALLQVAVRNLFVGNFRSAEDYPTLIKQRQQECALLREVAEDRLRLISLLETVIEKRRQILQDFKTNHEDESCVLAK